MKEIESRQKIIDDFFREFLSYRPESIGVWFGAGLVVVIYGIYMCVPWVYHTDRPIDAIVLFLGFLGAYLYLQPYRLYRDITLQKAIPENKSIDQTLQYVPVDRAELCRYRRKKLLRFTTYTGIVYVGGQLLFSLAICHRLTIGTVVFAAFMGYILPLFTNMEWLQEWRERRKR